MALVMGACAAVEELPDNPEDGSAGSSGSRARYDPRAELREFAAAELAAERAARIEALQAKHAKEQQIAQKAAEGLVVDEKEHHVRIRRGIRQRHNEEDDRRIWEEGKVRCWLGGDYPMVSDRTSDREGQTSAREARTS